MGILLEPEVNHAEGLQDLHLGNVVDLAVGIIIGVTFGTVVSSFVKNLLTPLISIPGKANFSALHFTVRHSVFFYGTFLNDLISFLIVAAAVFFFVVRPLNALTNRMHRGEVPDDETTLVPRVLDRYTNQGHPFAACTAQVEPVG